MAVATIALVAIPANAAQPYRARATLASVETPLKGKAIFQQKNNHQGPYRLDVHVNRAMPFETLDVVVDGVFIGQITTNAGGSGRLRLKNIAEAIPAGAMITVGPSAGVFATPGHN